MIGGTSSVVDLLRALVQTPSVTPHGDPGTPHTGEAAIAQQVGAILEELGADVQHEMVEPDRPNVLGRFPSNPTPDSSPKPVLALAPHTDTVGVGGMTIDPFGGALRDGRVYGRGACDTKGTLAAMLWALHELTPQGIATLGCEIWFAALMGEEWNQEGSKHFARHHARNVDFALVGEPTRCMAVVRTKGALWPTLVADGHAVHGSKPHLGENAIAKMAAVATLVDTDFRTYLQRPDWDDPLLGSSTVNLGVIRGGSRPNIVADRCELQLDIRITPAFHRAGALDHLRQFLEGAGCDVRTTAAPPSPPLETPLDNPFVQKLESVGATPTGAPWFSDASWLSAGGIPSAIAGPGDIDQAHTADEWIATSELERGVTFYRRFLQTC